VVIVDVWVQRLYRQHPLAQPLGYEPLGTFDTDIVVPLHQPATGGLILEWLLEGELRKELIGDTQPLAANYQVQSCDSDTPAPVLSAP
jgi:hypothetical protein